jgi:hypothetical protein
LGVRVRIKKNGCLLVSPPGLDQRGGGGREEKREEEGKKKRKGKVKSR